jgi:hypothetical protein
VSTAATSFAHPPQLVKPRNRTFKHHPVVAVGGGWTLSEHGEVQASEALYGMLPSMPSTLFAIQNAVVWLSQLDAHFGGDPAWQWRVTASERDVVRPDGVKIASRPSTLVHYFGFKHGNYHKLIDPVSMYGHRLSTIWPENTNDELTALLEWAVTLRNFCEQNRLDVRPTVGGISAQFLTDKRFYPKARRKVPAAINERAREAMPGNHYHLVVAPSYQHEFTAYYLDQHRAHHYHARTVPLPDSNHLYAHGDFIDLERVAFNRPMDQFYGLYCLDLEWPRKYRRSYWITGREKQFVFSNELPHLTDMGYKITGVRAAWGSFQRDTGVPKYARWATAQLDEYGDRPWLKPLLLATYGVLATRPKVMETIFCQAKRGERITVIPGNLTGWRVRGSKKLDPSIANVLQRGMIEAATRSESVGFAQYLTDCHGLRILSIYADAVIVEDHPDKPLPELLEPWRCKQKLNHLQFINQQAFISGEMTKLPGVSRELMNYRQHAPGHAPRRTFYEALSGKPVRTDRRI